MASETSVKLLFASFSVVSLEGRCDKEPGGSKPKDSGIGWIILGFGTAQSSQFSCVSPADSESNTHRGYSQTH